MGGIPRIYVRPIPDYPADKWRSTYSAHTRRNPPSKEPGVDYYCPLGTTLVSIGDGYVSEVGGSIRAAAGRYVKVNLDNGQSFRLLHLGPRHCLKRVGDRVRRGEPLAISGASGYGSEYFGASSPYDSQMILTTGGPHTHATLFPTHSYNNFVGLLDLEQWVMDSAPAGGTSSPLLKEWDEMATEQQIKDIAEKMRNLYIITHASADADNGIYVVAPGHWRKIGGPANDIARVYVDGDGETVYSRATPLTTGGNWAVLVRYWEMFAPAGVRLDGSLATGVDGEMIAARAELAVREALKSLSVDVDEQAIATAVRDEFVKRPLS
jgi:hypothetical protein